MSEIVQFVTQPNCNDVILGRGFVARENPGTKRFHQLCRMNWEEYCSSSKQETKNIVAYRIMNTISASNPPGRYLESLSLQKATSLGFRGFCVGGTVWRVVDDKVALKKTKQTIRDMKHGVATTSESSLKRAPQTQQRTTVSDAAVSQPAQIISQEASYQPNSKLSPCLNDEAGESVVEQVEKDQETTQTARVVFHGGKALFNADNESTREQAEGSVRINEQIDNGVRITAEPQKPTATASVSNTRQQEKRALAQKDYSSLLTEVHTEKSHDLVSFAKTHAGFSADEHEAANQLLTLLTLNDAPQFTAEDEKKEWAQLTEEERVAAAQDLFGASFPIFQSQKRVKRSSQDPVHVSSLLVAMVYEIERIPAEKRQALIEALARANEEEFSNERLEVFLRLEDMDPKKAAERFVTYWTERRLVFGSTKYVLPITLSGALKDDMVCLRTGTYQLLPRLDSAGRHLLFRDIERDTREGYTWESSLRVYWYLIEVIAQQSRGRIGEFVHMPYGARTKTFWDFDRVLEDRIFSLDSSCLPARMCSFHPIAPPLLAFALKPIVYAIIDKRIRNRTFIHDVAQLPRSFEPYGIHRDMLPTDLGGTIEFDIVQWIQDRDTLERR